MYKTNLHSIYEETAVKVVEINEKQEKDTRIF